MRKQGFSPGVIRFFESYLVQRFTSYCWNNFKSDPMQADVGVGQGSGLSPVLSALYIAPVMKLYDIRASEFLDTTLLSYVDDGTIITQSRHLGVNMTVLKSAYGVIFDLFTQGRPRSRTIRRQSFFIFSRARNKTLPSVDLGYAPFTGTTPTDGPSSIGVTWASTLTDSSSSMSMSGIILYQGPHVRHGVGVLGNFCTRAPG